MIRKAAEQFSEAQMTLGDKVKDLKKGRTLLTMMPIMGRLKVYSVS